MSARGRLSGQGTIEFVISGLAVMLTICAVLGFAFSSWQRSAIDYELDSLADSLPADWEGMSDEELVTYLLTKDSDLVEERLTLNNVAVDEYEEVEVRRDDPLAQAVGSQTATVIERWVEVSANVTYDVSSPIDLTGDGMAYTRTVHGSYLLERRYEVS